MEIRKVQMKMLKILDEIDRICTNYDIKYWLDSGTLLGAVRHKGFIPWDDDIDICMLREDYNRFQEIAVQELNSSFFMQTIDTDKFTENMFMKIRSRNSIMKINPREKGHMGIFVDVFPVDYYSINNQHKIKTKRKIMFMTMFYWMKYAKIKKPMVKNLKGNLVKITAKIYFKLRRNFDFQNIVTLVKSELGKTSNIKDENSYLGYGIEVPFGEKWNIEEILPLENIEFEGKRYPAPKNKEKYLENFYGDYMQLPKIEERKPSHCYELKLDLTEDEYIKLNENYM